LIDEVGLFLLCLGYEVSGVIDELCSTVPPESNLSVGDRVVVYPTCEDEEAGDGYVTLR